MIEITGDHEIRITIKDSTPDDDGFTIQLDDPMLRLAIELGLSGKWSNAEESPNTVDFAYIEYPDNLTVSENGTPIPTEEAMGFLGDFIVHAIKKALERHYPDSLDI